MHEMYLKMAKIYSSCNHLTIVCFNEFFAFSNKGGKWVYQNTIKCTESENESTEMAIESCAFSPCGKYFGVCHNKSLLIYDTLNWKILHSFAKLRKTSSMNFFPQNNIILLAFKNGSVSFYSFKDGKLKSSLGHNSMLTGSLVTYDGSYVITCDRDEKIRISHYPNVYDIERYCLGHYQFISCMEFLPSNLKVLVSSSGDGNIKFWDFMSGKELASYSCSSGKINDDTNTIIKFTSCQINSISVLAVLQYKSSVIKLFLVESKGTNVSLDVLKVLNFQKVPWDIFFYENYLLCLMPDKENPFSVWSVSESNVIEENFNFAVIREYLISNWDLILSLNSKISTDISVLFKRDIDNLQEYLQRKKARLIKTGKTS